MQIEWTFFPRRLFSKTNRNQLKSKYKKLFSWMWDQLKKKKKENNNLSHPIPIPSPGWLSVVLTLSRQEEFSPPGLKYTATK